MGYKIVIVEEAKLDFKTVLDWYKSIHPKLGDTFSNSFKESLKIIKSNPLLFQIRYDKTRVALIENFPYLIHCNSYDNTIVIKLFFILHEILKYGLKGIKISKTIIFVLNK